jgi:hypothetical protein
MQINVSQGFALTWKVLYYLSNTSRPCLFGYFLRAGVSHFLFLFFFFFELDWPGSNFPHLILPSTSDYRQWPLVPGSVWPFHTSMWCTLIRNTLLHTSCLSSSFPQIVPSTFMSFKILICHRKTLPT